MRHLLPFFTVALFATLMSAPLSRADPPVLHRFTILPSPVADVSQGQAQLTFEVDFSALEVFNRMDLTFTSSAGDEFYGFAHPSRADFTTSGNNKKGIFTGSLTVPGFRAADLWQISATLFDQAGGSTEYPVLPSGSSTTLTTINTSGTVDLLPPVLTSASRTLATVDITTGPQSVTFTITAEDDAGLERLSIYLDDPARRYRAGIYLTAMERISGTAQSGTWQGTLSVPALGPPGTYEIGYYLEDRSQRWSYYGTESNPAPNIPTTLTVTTSGPVDSAGPVLTAISASQQEVDVTDEAQTVRLDLAAMDAPAGIQYISATLSAADGNGQSQSAYYDEAAPYITELVGSSVEFRISKYTPPGQYRWTVNIGDGADFSSSYGHDALPFPGGFSGTLSVVNSGMTRGTPPVASSFSRTPATLPDGALPGLVEYTVQVSDPAPITSVYGYLFKLPGITGPRNGFSLKLIEGTPQNGTWQGRLKLGASNLPGDYVTGFVIYDQTGDVTTYGAWPSYFEATPYPPDWPGNFTITTGGPALTAYQSWSLGYFPTGTAGAAESDDPDGDGWPNALEFLLEMSPLNQSLRSTEDPFDNSPRIEWNPKTYRMSFTPSLLNPTLGTGTSLKLKAWKSTTLGPGSWSSVPSQSLGFGPRFFPLNAPDSQRKQQFLRLTVEP